MYDYVVIEIYARKVYIFMQVRLYDGRDCIRNNKYNISLNLLEDRYIGQV